jgi:predicted RNA-binding protein YlxR (DUF448 family)
LGAEDKLAQDHDEGVDATGSLRRCVVTRKELAPDDLLRFVLDPSGAVVPDLARKLPGRGVWVTADKASVAQAVKANAFAKSLKRQATVAFASIAWPSRARKLELLAGSPRTRLSAMVAA